MLNIITSTSFNGASICYGSRTFLDITIENTNDFIPGDTLCLDLSTYISVPKINPAQPAQKYTAIIPPAVTGNVTVATYIGATTNDIYNITVTTGTLNGPNIETIVIGIEYINQLDYDDCLSQYVINNSAHVNNFGPAYTFGNSFMSFMVWYGVDYVQLDKPISFTAPCSVGTMFTSITSGTETGGWVAGQDLVLDFTISGVNTTINPDYLGVMIQECPDLTTPNNVNYFNALSVEYADFRSPNNKFGMVGVPNGNISLAGHTKPAQTGTTVTGSTTILAAYFQPGKKYRINIIIEEPGAGKVTCYSCFTDCICQINEIPCIDIGNITATVGQDLTIQAGGCLTNVPKCKSIQFCVNMTKTDYNAFITAQTGLNGNFDTNHVETKAYLSTIPKSGAVTGTILQVTSNTDTDNVTFCVDYVADLAFGVTRYIIFETIFNHGSYKEHVLHDYKITMSTGESTDLTIENVLVDLEGGDYCFGARELSFDLVKTNPTTSQACGSIEVNGVATPLVLPSTDISSGTLPVTIMLPSAAIGDDVCVKMTTFEFAGNVVTCCPLMFEFDVSSTVLNNQIEVLFFYNLPAQTTADVCKVTIIANNTELFEFTKATDADGFFIPIGGEEMNEVLFDITVLLKDGCMIQSQISYEALAYQNNSQSYNLDLCL